jgi:uncharacterized membrane protein YfcA
MDALSHLLPAGLGAGTAALLVAASFFTSALTAGLGIGGGVALLSVMGYVLPVAALIPVHGVVQLGSNAGRALVQRAHIGWAVILPFLAGSAAGAAAGAPFVTELDDPPLKIALGAFIIAATWWKVPALRDAKPAVIAFGGAATTFLTMFFGATGPLTAAFLEKAFAERRAYVASHAAAMTMQHAFKILAFGFAGFAFGQWAGVIAAMILSGFAGTLLGSRLLAALPEETFRIAFRWLLTLLALDIMRRGAIAML